MRTFIVIFTLIFLAAANVHLNIKYRSVLEGKQQLNETVAKKIYSDFRSPFHPASDYRFKIFKQKLFKIRNHNQKANVTWKRGINRFSDFSFEEFKANRLMAPQECSATSSLKTKPTVTQIPGSYEWGNYGVLTPVKDQGDCGSCWTFSTVGTLEAFWNIKGKGKNLTFSEQQLVDCAWDFQNQGCDGGLPSQAFEYIRYAGGIESDVTYPYNGEDNECKFRRNLAVGYVRYGSYNITQGDQEELAERLYNAGPIAVSFEVLDDFEDYISGIYTSDQCGTTSMDVNHAVVATGYGVENGVKYWNVKNSWSTDWGELGYFKIERGTNMCAISQCNSYPLIDNASLEGIQYKK